MFRKIVSEKMEKATSKPTTPLQPFAAVTHKDMLKAVDTAGTSDETVTHIQARGHRWQREMLETFCVAALYFVKIVVHRCRGPADHASNWIRVPSTRSVDRELSSRARAPMIELVRSRCGGDLQ